MDLQQYLNEKKSLVDRALDRFLPPEDAEPTIIHKAMRYSAMDGGKRIRPVLTIATAEALNDNTDNVMPVACAIEMIHAFSLIHDDLPCMDDDDLRRGKPTSHKVFGEAVALLAGDALFAFAFETISRTPKTVSADVVARVIALIASASGTSGMVGGQILDLMAEGKETNIKQVQLIHQRKTGALLLASVLAGAEIAGANSEEMSALTKYGENIGLSFQIIDDILDIEGEETIIGKKTGADAKLKKATYPAAIGLERSKVLAKEAADSAVQVVTQTLGHRGARLVEIANFIVGRKV